jgi:hypothetical protein
MVANYTRITLLIGAVGLSSCGMTDQDIALTQASYLNKECFSNKAVNSRKQVDVEFKNNFSGPLEVVWLDYEGDQVPYGTLAPGGVVKMSTYVSHPWSFIYAETGNCVGYFNPKVGDDGKRIEMVKY